ncbi:nitroreductase family protein [Nonomuraea sp. NPDC050536]|uniref:nitroreductase family protein n=1 Tax=Nonomuraea sp. NPDC050536 TaxID=3364366 RepID=UPI0037CB5BCD
MTNAHTLAAELIQAFRVHARRTRSPEAVKPEAVGPAVRAEPITGERTDLLSTLARRRSQRFFEPGPIPAGLLAGVIDSGITEDESAWPGEQELQTDVVAVAVEGLEPAMYSYAARAYTPVAPLPPERELENLTLQAEFGRSAAIVSIAVDLSGIDAHGYRMLLGRASAAAYTMWLDAVALGLAGTVFAGFIPASVRRPLRADGTGRHHVFALAVGREPLEHRKE